MVVLGGVAVSYERGTPVSPTHDTLLVGVHIYMAAVLVIKVSVSCKSAIACPAVESSGGAWLTRRAVFFPRPSQKEANDDHVVFNP